MVFFVTTTKNRRKVSVKNFFSLSIEDPEFFAKLEKKLNISIEEFRGEICTSLESENVITKTLKLPNVSFYKRNKLIAFEAEKLLPFSLKQACVCVCKRDDKACVSMHAVRLRILLEKISAYQTIHLDPDIITSETQSLLRVADKLSNYLPTYLFCFGREGKYWLILKQNGYIENALVIEEVENVEKQLSRGVQFLHSQAGSSLAFFTLGDGEKHKRYLLEQNHVLKELQTNPIEDFNNEDLASYAIALGAGLDYLIRDKQSVQFRSNALLSKRSYRKARKRLVTASLSVLAIFLVGLFFVNKSLNNYQENLSKRLHLITETLNIEQIDEKNLDICIDKHLKNFRLVNLSAGFYKTPPLVTSFLYWCSAHPLLQGNATIKTLRYEAEKYPSLEKPFTPFVIRVQLIIDCEDQKKMQKFHQALKGESSIEQKRAITYSKNHTKHHFEFYLKNASV